MKFKNYILPLLILATLIIISLLAGRYSISVNDIADIISGKCDNQMTINVFTQIRLPRTILVVLSGAALALSGFVFQNIFKNPLVSPDVLGVGSGASIGVILSVIMPVSALSNSMSSLLSFSMPFAFGIFTVTVSLLLSAAVGKSNGNGIYNMVISGIIISSICNSVIMILKFTADPERQLAAIEYWLMGSFANCVFSDVYAVFPIILISVILLYIMRGQIALLSFGDEEAMSLGVSVSRVRITGILISTLLVSSVVSVAGAVSWIGLIVPHAVRIIFGDKYRMNFTQTIICGGILLLISDILARSLFSAEIPISILTTLIGAGFLFVFLITQRRKFK